MGLLVDDRPISVDGEEEVSRVGTDFTFPSITLENPTVLTYFEGNELYREMRVSLVGHLMCLPSHREIVWWLEECFRAQGHGFPYFFRKGGPFPMDGRGRSISSDYDYSWVDGEVTKVVSYYQSIN